MYAELARALAVISWTAIRGTSETPFRQHLRLV